MVARDVKNGVTRVLLNALVELDSVHELPLLVTLRPVRSIQSARWTEQSELETMKQHLSVLSQEGKEES